MIHLSSLLRAPVIDTQYENVGRLIDVITRTDQQIYPKVEAIKVKKGKDEVIIPWTQVENIGEKEITLIVKKERITPFSVSKDHLLLADEVLDKQIVDMKGVRVVRVNDLELGRVGTSFAVLGIDVSNWSLLRRLGIKLGAIPFYRPSNVGYIDWKDVTLVGRHEGKVKLKTQLATIEKVHPADIANLVEHLNLQEGSHVVRSLDAETAAKVLSEVDPRIRNVLVSLIGEQRAIEIIGEMPPDEIADLIRRMPIETSDELLTKLEGTEQHTIKKLSGYRKNTAGSLMSTAIVTVLPSWTIGQAQKYTREISKDFASIYYLYVTDEDKHLLGVLSVRTLFVSPPDVQVSSVMTTNMITVRSKMQLSKVARIMTKYNLLAVSVVNGEGRIQGIISVDDIMRYLVPDA